MLSSEKTNRQMIGQQICVRSKAEQSNPLFNIESMYEVTVLGIHRLDVCSSDSMYCQTEY